MKAILLKKQPGNGMAATLSDVPVPSLKPGDILVQVKACGLCGTDIEKIKGEYSAAMPVIGHEAVGVVTAMGEGVEGVAVGDRVFPHHHVPCGRCYFCLHGSETMCPDYKVSNIDPGGFSEFVRVPQWNVSRGGVFRLPGAISDQEGTMLEPLACCVRAFERCSIKAGDDVLVVGAGPVGMAHALLLRHVGANAAISDVSDARLRFAEKAGVGVVIDASKADVPDRVKRETHGRGADVAIVASGSQKAVAQAMKSVRRGGKVCLFGIPVRDSKLEYGIDEVYYSDLSIVSSYGATEKDMAKALDLMASRSVDVSGLITHRFSLEEFDRGVRAAVTGEAMKVVIAPK